MTEQDARAGASERIGAVLCGKYHLDRVLGAGGMATVYAATHLRNANRVAVKILHREVAMDSGLRGRFLREGYAANSVDHPGTVRVLDDDTAADGSVFLVMELLDGETLDARWERSGRRLDAPEVVRLLCELLDVLSAAHARGIVHRDIKPENLFLTRSGELKVLDFGVARLAEPSPTKTRSGAVFGTPAFLPPEQALGHSAEIDALSDVWAVGATAFSLLAGRFVHDAQTAGETFVRAATQPAPPLASVAPDVPAPIAHVIDRALAFDKRDRWPSADAMRDALSRTLEQPATEPVPPPAPDTLDDDKTRLYPSSQSLSRGPGSTSSPGTSDLAPHTTIAMPTLAAASTAANVQALRPEPRASRRPMGHIGLAASGLALLAVLATALAVARGGKPVAAPEAPPNVRTGAPSDALVPSVAAAPERTGAMPIAPATTSTFSEITDVNPKAIPNAPAPPAASASAVVVDVEMLPIAPAREPPGTPIARASTSAKPIQSAPPSLRPTAPPKRDPLAP